jgi:DNA modification methylase
LSATALANLQSPYFIPVESNVLGFECAAESFSILPGFLIPARKSGCNKVERATSDGSEIVSLFGREILRLGSKRRKHYLKRALEYWRASGFPYVRLSPSQVDSQYRALANTRLEASQDGHLLGSSCVGLRLANSYHPQMWHARSHGHKRSPFDYFQDDYHLRNMLERAPRFWPNKRCWSPQAVRNLARIYSGGRVANFRPVVARSVVHRFSGIGDLVLDFSAGYGGRLLACLTLGRAYMGIDPAAKQVFGLKRMYDDLRVYSSARVEIVRGCAEEALADVRRQSADLVFSSPPFFKLEVYSDEPSQSAHRYATYDAWRSLFLQVVVAQSHRVLRRKGFFAINVSNHRTAPLESDTLRLASKLFRHSSTISVEMRARPLERSQNGRAFRTEPIHVFQKR